MTLEEAKTVAVQGDRAEIGKVRDALDALFTGLRDAEMAHATESDGLKELLRSKEEVVRHWIARAEKHESEMGLDCHGKGHEDGSALCKECLLHDKIQATARAEKVEAELAAKNAHPWGAVQWERDSWDKKRAAFESKIADLRSNLEEAGGIARLEKERVRAMAETIESLEKKLAEQHEYIVELGAKLNATKQREIVLEKERDVARGNYYNCIADYNTAVLGRKDAEFEAGAIRERVEWFKKVLADIENCRENHFHYVVCHCRSSIRSLAPINLMATPAPGSGEKP